MPDENTVSTNKSTNIIFGILNLIVVFIIVNILWYIFFHPNGILKLYTPNYGFSIVVVLLSSIVLLRHVLGTKPIILGSNKNYLANGILMTIITVAVTLFLIYIFFWNFLGALGIAYFSPQSIIDAGGVGAEPWNARENASLAIVYAMTPLLWWGLFWVLGFKDYPWSKNNKTVLAVSRFFAVAFFSILTFSILFHSSICYFFEPVQSKAGVEPWWSEFALTDSPLFALGIILCIIFWIICSDQLWEGYPWKKLQKNEEGNLVKGIVTWLATVALGAITMYILYKIFNAIWYEPFPGGQYTDSPSWRYRHAATVSGFFILSVFIVKVYLFNIVRDTNIWLSSLIRTIATIILGMIIYWFYFSFLGETLLGRTSGFAQPDDLPLVWIILFISIILIHKEYFRCWPLYKQGD